MSEVASDQALRALGFELCRTVTVAPHSNTLIIDFWCKHLQFTPLLDIEQDLLERC